LIRTKHEHLFLLGLNEHHYDRFIQLLEDSMRTLGLPSELIHEALQTIGPIRHVFVEGGAMASRGY